MYTLIIGIIIWMDVHFFKRVLPKQREALNTQLGAGRARGLISLVLIVSVVMMVIGYRSWFSGSLYTPPSWTAALSIPSLMIAVALMGLGSSKSRLRGKLRHPMLVGVIVWAAAHLLMRGDWASIVLFGGMIVWAALSIQLINRTEGPWQPKAVETSRKGDIRLAVITVVLTAIIMGLHHLIIHVL